MVKVTIEQDGEVRKYEGELFAGMMATSAEKTIEYHALIFGGEGRKDDIPDILESMVYSVITYAADSPVEAAVMLINLSEGLDERIRKHLVENEEAFTDNTRKIIREMGGEDR